MNNEYNSQGNNNQLLDNQIQNNTEFDQSINQNNIQNHMNNYEDNNINNKFPQRKKNIGLIVRIAAIIMLAGIGIIYGSKHFFNKNDDNPTDINENVETTKNPKYESSLLHVYNLFEGDNINGNIISMIGDSTYNNFILTKDNKVYNNVIGKFHYLLTVDKNFKKMIHHGGINLLTENKDKSFTIYSSSNPDVKYDFNADDVVFVALGSPYPIIFTLENGCLYYQSNGKKQIAIDEGNARLSSSLINKKCDIKHVHPGLQSLEIIRENGDAYYVSLNNISEVLYTNSNYGIITNVDKIFVSEGIPYYTPPFYSIKSDKNNLYVRESGFKLDRLTYTIKLPNNYTTNDIKEMHASEELILIMNDKNVYYKENIEETSSWELSEELTNLYKNNHIINISETNTKIFVLCDDNYLYDLN